MEYRTYNYGNLEEMENKSADFAIANVSFHPSVLVERCEILLRDFIEEYFTSTDTKELIYEIEARKEVMSAKIYSIYEQLNLASAMLEEIQNYKPKERILKNERTNG